MDLSHIQMLLLSGPLAAGKSSVATALIANLQFARVRSGTYLASYAASRHMPIDRTGLHNVGDMLDLETDYRWLIENVAHPAISSDPAHTKWLIDAVRKRRQVEHFRSTFPRVTHAHLFASDDVLKQRYESRSRQGADYTADVSYEDAVKHPNEVAARSLRIIADIAIDLGQVSAEDAALLIVQSLR